jgi:hypothetical protein
MTSNKISMEAVPSVILDNNNNPQNRYLIGNYALPNNLKCIRKTRDPKDQEMK